MKTISYTLNDAEEKAAKDFVDEQFKIAIEKQRQTMSPKDFEHFTQGGKYPYMGAIGGGTSYEIYHTSIGKGIIIHCCGEKKDITDFTNW